MEKDLIKLEIYYLEKKDELTQFERDIILKTIQICNIKLEEKK